MQSTKKRHYSWINLIRVVLLTQIAHYFIYSDVFQLKKMLLCFWFSFLPVMIRKRKFYNKTSLDSALADIKMNKLSAKKVSIKLEVPVRTLRYRNKNWVSEQVYNSWPGNELGTICKLLYRKSFSFDTEKWLRYPLLHTQNSTLY